jgi:hypothetical protein
MLRFLLLIFCLAFLLRAEQEYKKVGDQWDHGSLFKGRLLSLIPVTLKADPIANKS